MVKQRLEFKVRVEGYGHSGSNLEEFERRKNSCFRFSLPS